MKRLTTIGKLFLCCVTITAGLFMLSILSTYVEIVDNNDNRTTEEMEEMGLRVKPAMTMVAPVMTAVEETFQTPGEPATEIIVEVEKEIAATIQPVPEPEQRIYKKHQEPKKITKKLKPLPVQIYEPIELPSKNVPILMYHTSSENNPGPLTGLYVKPSEFEKQVQYLIESGFTFCTFDDYYNLDNINKPIFITFDDGYKENYTEIYPILKKYKAKITIFLALSSITPSNMTKEMIIEMSDSGLVKFESHTNNHPSLVAISFNNARLTDELQNSKLKIEEITGRKVLALAYPNGEFNSIVKQKTKEFYLFGLRKDLGMHNTAYDDYEVRRIRIDRSTSIETFKILVR